MEFTDAEVRSFVNWRFRPSGFTFESEYEYNRPDVLAYWQHTETKEFVVICEELEVIEVYSVPEEAVEYGHSFLQSIGVGKAHIVYTEGKRLVQDYTKSKDGILAQVYEYLEKNKQF